MPAFHIKAACGLRRGLDMLTRGNGNTFATAIRTVP